jgi:hypothetical protein
MKHLGILFTAAIVTAVMVAACGGTAKEASSASAVAETPSTVSAPAEAAPAAKAPPAVATPTSASQKYTCPMHPEVIADGPGRCPKCGMNLEPKTASTSPTNAAHQVYTCPMAEHADVISDKPGKCPKCGMDLVLKPMDGHEPAGGGYSH